jgi:hypothetical protein
VSMPIQFKNTRCAVRRAAMEREEKRVQSFYDRHQCRDGADCLLLQLENVIAEAVAREVLRREKP